MTIFERVRNGETGIVVAGNHPGIIQSILDFDFLSGKQEPSIVACVMGNRSALKFSWGSGEVLIPCVKNMSALSKLQASRVRWLLNVQSGRRAVETTHLFFETFPEALGAHIFAENVPEVHALSLVEKWGTKKLIAGPSGVGILVPGHLKMGASGGVGLSQIAQGKLTHQGSCAVVSTSGGMTNELIVAAARAGKGTSFSVSIGGDRFPATSLGRVLQLAEEDSATQSIVYFGELGGVDEYEVAELLVQKKITKPVVAYVAGTIDDAFEERMQFGHAKALVASQDESARAKRDALRAAGAVAPDTFEEFLDALKKLPGETIADTEIPEALSNRRASILSTRELVDLSSAPVYVRDTALTPARPYAFARATLSALIGRNVHETTAAFVENIFELLIDHGGNVSGAVNTMVTARAGKDLVSSLAAGLLTIGPRFGGAVNESARTWLRGVSSGQSAVEFVESETKAGRLILGIGHRKYRVGLPDPRVESLAEFSNLLKRHAYYDFARGVEKVTTGKQGTLILNVDGAMAALLLDILAEYEGYSEAELQGLADMEFFNALFVIPRTVGFIGHFMEQKKNDEGLFRLPDELLFVRKDKNTGADQ